MLKGNEQYSSEYTPEEKLAFNRHLSSLNAYSETCDVEELKEILLGIYANPIESKNHFTQN
jgi:hypothetical protein